MYFYEISLNVQSVFYVFLNWNYLRFNVFVFSFKFSDFLSIKAFLCFILVREKAEILVQIEQLISVKDELTEQVHP